MGDFSMLCDELAAEMARREGASGARRRFAAAPPLAKAAAPNRDDLPALMRKLKAGAGELERHSAWVTKALNEARTEQAENRKAAERARLARIGELADRLIAAGELPPSLAAGIDQYLMRERCA